MQEITSSFSRCPRALSLEDSDQGNTKINQHPHQRGFTANYYEHHVVPIYTHDAHHCQHFPLLPRRRKRIRDHIAAPAKLQTATVAPSQSDRSHVQNLRSATPPQRGRTSPFPFSPRRFRFRDGEKAEPAPARPRSPGGGWMIRGA